MYYKFRDLKNYKYLLDILLNQRLYSASFRSLNDNFEGQFYSDYFDKRERYRLNPTKQKHLSICSFSTNYKSHLMWSHYAEGHKGIAIGFEVDETEYNVEKVNYEGLLNLNNMPRKFKDVKDVFLNKIKDWKYEKEYRIITESQDFINIDIKEIIFGAETPKEDKAIIEKLIKILNKEIKIETYYGENF